MVYREHFVPRGKHLIYAREYEGEEPARLVLSVPLHARAVT
jgi:hypothetical protein